MSFIDIYHRIGLYPLPLPATLGVEAVGPDVTHLSPGDRVAYTGAPVGAYASTRLLPQARAIALPADISPQLAAGSMLRGITTHMLLTRTYPVGPETTILVHAAAGGTGGLLVRWAKHLGARVIGTAGSPEKADLARTAGADQRQAAGPIPPLSVDEIGPRRALTLARPSFMAYASDQQRYQAAADAVLNMVRLGVAGAVGRSYP